MRVFSPLLHWHGAREKSKPVYGVSVRPHSGPITSENPLRVVTCGESVCSWEIVPQFANETDEPKVEFRAEFGREIHLFDIYNVRFSRDGESLLLGDGDGAISLWKQIPHEKGWTKISGQLDERLEVHEDWNKQTFGNLQRQKLDITGLAWSADGRFYIATSLDSTLQAVVVDTSTKGVMKELIHGDEPVLGCAWDPNSKYAVTLSTDRHMRIFEPLCTDNEYRLKPLHDISKHMNGDGMFYGVDVSSFRRRPDFSPDGRLLVVPAGVYKDVPCSYVFRFDNNKVNRPAAVLPSNSPTVCVKFCPVRFTLRASTNATGSKDAGTMKDKSSARDTEMDKPRLDAAGTSCREMDEPESKMDISDTTDLNGFSVNECDKEMEISASALLQQSEPLPNKADLSLPSSNGHEVDVDMDNEKMDASGSEDGADGSVAGSTKGQTETVMIEGLGCRYIFAIVSEDPLEIHLYDTQMARPFAVIGDVHVQDITDLGWSSDGRVLIVTSGDGFVSFVEFDEGELGDEYQPMDDDAISVAA